MVSSYAADGIFTVNHFLSRKDCEELLNKVGQYQRGRKIPTIYRPAAGRPLNYSVIDGHRIARHLPELLQLNDKVTNFIKTNSDPELAPLVDTRVACNVNITSRGGTYRYHYDRNAVTAILYLNEIDGGGETECYPNYRLDFWQRKYPRFQKPLDSLLQNRAVRRLSGKLTIVRPEPGKLLVMRGKRCLHSVRPVHGNRERVNVVMAYDYPDVEFDVGDELNSYLYNDFDEVAGADPNYR